jgi:hypothetical protein
LNFIVTLPLFRVRTLFVPFFGSLADVPTKASFKFHTPEENVTSPAVYDVFVPSSNVSEIVILLNEAADSKMKDCFVRLALQVFLDTIELRGEEWRSWRPSKSALQRSYKPRIG